MSNAAGLGTYDRELNYARANHGSARLTSRQFRRSGKKQRSRIAKYVETHRAGRIDVAVTATVEMEQDRARVAETLRYEIPLYKGTAGRMQGRGSMLVVEDEVFAWANPEHRVIEDVHEAGMKAWEQGGRL